MMNYNWPGNVRELKNCIQRLCILGSLSDEIINFEQPPGASPRAEKLFDREKELVENALLKADGNISRAAEALGIGRKALYNRIAKYNLTVPKGTL
jgi:two-component system C4-dicarboxylate transport response regulator DctD